MRHNLSIMSDSIEIYMPPECSVCHDRAYWYEFGKYRCNTHRHKCPQNNDRPHPWDMGCPTVCGLCGVVANDLAEERS